MNLFFAKRCRPERISHAEASWRNWGICHWTADGWWGRWQQQQQASVALCVVPVRLDWGPRGAGIPTPMATSVDEQGAVHVAMGEQGSFEFIDLLTISKNISMQFLTIFIENFCNFFAILLIILKIFFKIGIWCPVYTAAHFLCPLNFLVFKNYL